MSKGKNEEPKERMTVNGTGGCHCEYNKTYTLEPIVLPDGRVLITNRHGDSEDSDYDVSVLELYERAGDSYMLVDGIQVGKRYASRGLYPVKSVKIIDTNQVLVVDETNVYFVKLPPAQNKSERSAPNRRVFQNVNDFPPGFGLKDIDLTPPKD